MSNVPTSPDAMCVLDKIHAVQEFAALYAHLRISTEQCLVQFELAAHNKLLTDQSPKTLTMEIESTRGQNSCWLPEASSSSRGQH